MRAYSTRLAYHSVIAASPLPFIFTCPESSTDATPSSLDPYRTQRVTSRRRPSEYFARTTICCSAPAFRTAVAGNTSSPVTVGSLSDGRGAPAAIHSAITRYSSESVANRLPPPCGTANVGFSSIRLCDGSEGETRRPIDCRVRVSYSSSGSAPRSVSLNPFLPAAAPWHAPELQPTLLITGITSLRKLHVCASCAFFT